MKSYEEILAELLARVPDDLSKAEGSPVQVAIAPMAVASAELQAYCDNIFDATMPDTACGEEQSRICASFGVERDWATPAERKGVFANADKTPAEVALGTRFGAEGLSYTITEKLAAGEYRLTCSRAGAIGNSYFGAILPLDNGISLGSATLTGLLVPGEDEESDEHYRARFYRMVNTRVTGSNAAWYEQEVGRISGVGSVWVFPTPGGQGGRVHCVITDGVGAAASETLLANVQAIIDPAPSGSGSGMAPCEHYFSVSTVSVLTLDVTARVWLRVGYALETVRGHIEAAIGKYLSGVGSNGGVVRIAHIEAAIVGSEGVADVADTTMNGGTSNVSLAAQWDNFELPRLGELTLTAEV